MADTQLDDFANNERIERAQAARVRDERNAAREAARRCRDELNEVLAELARLRVADAILRKLVEDGWVTQADVDSVAGDLSEERHG